LTDFCSTPKVVICSGGHGVCNPMCSPCSIDLKNVHGPNRTDATEQLAWQVLQRKWLRVWVTCAIPGPAPESPVLQNLLQPPMTPGCQEGFAKPSEDQQQARTNMHPTAAVPSPFTPHWHMCSLVPAPPVGAPKPQQHMCPVSAAGREDWRLPWVHLGPGLIVPLLPSQKAPLQPPNWPGPCLLCTPHTHNALPHPPCHNACMAHCKTWEEVGGLTHPSQQGHMAAGLHPRQLPQVHLGPFLVDQAGPGAPVAATRLA
jgi:hypothetical protein